LASSSAFGSRPTRLASVQRRFNGVLVGYWRVCSWVYGIILAGGGLTGLAWWVLQSVFRENPVSLAELLDYPPIRAVAAIPWPITVIAIVLIVASVVVASQASRDRLYYEVLDACAEGYRNVRLNYRAIAAQVKIDTGTSRDAPDGALAAFDDRLYTERADAVRVYTDFLNQRKHRILLLVGRGGSGKSTFLLRRMAELAGVLPAGTASLPPHPCVFVNCKLDHVNDANKLDAIVKSKLRGRELTDVLRHAVRRRHDRAVVVFVDAINENYAPAGDDINVHLTNFARQYLAGRDDVYLCLSVRRTYWDEQRRRITNNPTSADLGWLEYVYLPERRPEASTASQRGAETVSVLLEDFEPTEFDHAYARHQLVYDITGAIPDERTRRICSNPLMLQIFCNTFRGQDIRDLDSVRNLVRDKDIFDAYAARALGRIAEQMGLAATELIGYGEPYGKRAIRGLLLELALGTVEQGRLFLSAAEVFAIASSRVPEALSIGDRRIDTIDGLYQRGSALKAIIDEGIVLESKPVPIPGAGWVSGVWFVYERYLEYSIGRALVRRWRLESLSRQAIVEDFRSRMDEHMRLRGRSFDNLRQGLGMAILVAEEPEESMPALPPGIHLDLLSLLAHDAEFEWNQLACRVVAQLKTFNRAAHISPAPRQDVDALLVCLDELAKKNDFVLRWDIERALLHAVEAGEGTAVLRHLQGWMAPDATFAQRMFSGESLGYLFRHRTDYQRDVVDILRALSSTSPRLDFWILRSIMFSIGAMVDWLDGGAAAVEPDQALSDELRQLAQDLLRFGAHWWDRSVVLAGQIERDARTGRLASWTAWSWPQESTWTRVNAVLATEWACARGHATEQTVTFLAAVHESATSFEPHLSWAVWQVCGQILSARAADPRAQTAASALRQRIRGQGRRALAQDSRAAWVAQDEPDDAGPIATPVALVYHPEYGHTDLHNHPESKERVQAILDCLEGSADGGEDWRTLWTYVSPYRLRDFDAEQSLRRVHTREWIRRVQELSQQLAEQDKPDIVLESDLEVRAGSYEGAVLAVRGPVCAVDIVTSTPSVRLALALVRPPGHLAGNKICIFNNIAIAARYGQQVLSGPHRGQPRVLIVDCDAHHGKSTQDIFYDDNSVLYFSTHQAGVHPGTGKFAERGSGAGTGYTVNVPVPAGSGDTVYAEVLQRILHPVLRRFRPDLILVSLGFDGYCDDSFSQLEMSEWSYRQLALVLARYCGENPGVVTAASFEGGYDLRSIGRCVLQFTSVFGGWVPPGGVEPAPRASSSPLDAHLVSRGEAAAANLSDSDRDWLMQVEALEAELGEMAEPSTVLTADAGRA
jgi:acetoin utilization deacetylase AcuC-like enzyme